MISSDQFCDLAEWMTCVHNFGDDQGYFQCRNLFRTNFNNLDLFKHKRLIPSNEVFYCHFIWTPNHWLKCYQWIEEVVGSAILAWWLVLWDPHVVLVQACHQFCFCDTSAASKPKPTLYTYLKLSETFDKHYSSFGKINEEAGAKLIS